MTDDGYKELESIFNSRDVDRKNNKINNESVNFNNQEYIDISHFFEDKDQYLTKKQREKMTNEEMNNNSELKRLMDKAEERYSYYENERVKKLKMSKSKTYSRKINNVKAPKLVKKERKFKTYRSSSYTGKRIKYFVTNLGYIILLAGIGVVTVVGTSLLINAVVAFGKDNSKLDTSSNDIAVVRYDESSIDSDILESSISNEFSNSSNEVSNTSNLDINYSKIPIDNEFDEVKILNFLDNTQSGYYVQKYCDKYGVDPYVFSSICNVESGFDHFSCIPGGDFYNGYGVGICQIESPSGNEIGTYDVDGNYNTVVVSMDNMVDEEKNIEAGVISYKDNVDRLYYVLSNKYKDVDDSILKAATVYFSIPCYNMGLPAMMYIIENYDVIRDNQFCFQQFQEGLTYIHNNPSALVPGWEGLYGNDKYFEKVWSCLPPNQEINTFVDDEFVAVDTSYIRPAISQNQNAKVI